MPPTDHDGMITTPSEPVLRKTALDAVKALANDRDHWQAAFWQMRLDFDRANAALSIICKAYPDAHKLVPPPDADPPPGQA